MHNLDLRTSHSRDESEAERSEFAGQQIAVRNRRGSDRDQLAIAQSEQFDQPRIAVHNQEFSRPDAGIEIELLAGLVVVADDLDGQIGATEPVRVTILGRVVVEEDRNIGNSVVVCPFVITVGDVGAGKNFAQSSPVDHDLKDRHQESNKALMHVVRVGHDDVPPIPDLVFVVQPESAAATDDPTDRGAFGE